MLTLKHLITILLSRTSKLLDSVLVLLQALYLIRFPVLALLIIAVFMPVTLFVLDTLLANLYDLDSFPKTFWFSLSAFLLTFSTITTLKLILLYGGERVEFNRQTRKRLDAKTKKFVGSRLFFLAACVLTAVMISGVIIVGRDYFWLNILGAFAGFVAAMALLFMADILQRLLNRKSKAESLGGFLLPCKNPWADWANRCEYLYELSNKAFRPKFLEACFRNIPAYLGTGYMQYKPDGNPETDEEGRACVYPEHFTVIALFLFFFAIYLLVGWTPQGFRATLEVTALSYLMLLLTVLVWGLTALSFFLDRYRIPVLLTIVPLYLAASLTSHDYVFPVLNLKDNEIAALRYHPLTPAKVLDVSFRSSELQGEDYAIVVAANGGGIQAAAWTAQVLAGVERECKIEFGPAFDGCSPKIRLISSVSGGSVGAMYFLNSYTEGGIPDAKLDEVVENAKRSSLDAAAWGLVYPDFTRSFLPFYWSGYGRGHALEDEWAKGNNELKLGLLSWREGVKAGWRPASIFNATVVETGQRLLLSTSDICEKESEFGECLERAGLIEPVTPEAQAKAKIDKKSFYSFIEGKDIPIKTAARLSATFPYVTPVPRADLRPGEMQNFQHVADGGYYDNYGISSLIEWLNEGLSYKTKKNLKHILIVQIRGDQIVESTEKKEPSQRPYYQTLAPLYTILNVRTTGQLSNNEAELEIFMRYWLEKKENCVDIDTVIFEFPREKEKIAPPLSWHLSSPQKNEINMAWTKILNGTDRYKAWQNFSGFIKDRMQAGKTDPNSPCSE